MSTRSTFNFEALIVNLVTSIVSVNKWSLEDTSRIRPNMEQQGLFDLEVLRRLDVHEISDLLDRAGYTKAQFVRTLIASRLKDLAQTLQPADLHKLVESVERGDNGVVGKILLPIKGIGPVVLRQFLQLQKASSLVNKSGSQSSA